MSKTWGCFLGGSGHGPESSCQILANYKFFPVLHVFCRISTGLNAGRKGGVIKRPKDHLNKPLQWLVCLLYTNELPLCHLMKELDGGTSGPENFGSLIGKQLVGCELLDVVDFKAVQVPEITIDEKNLSSDQKYLLSIFNAVRMGFVSPHLASQNPYLSTTHVVDNCMPDTSALRFYLPTISCTDRLGTIYHERLCSCLVPDEK